MMYTVVLYGGLPRVQRVPVKNYPAGVNFEQAKASAIDCLQEHIFRLEMELVELRKLKESDLAFT